MILDSTCPTRLDLLNDPECPVIPVEPHTGPTPIIYTKTSDKTTTKPKVQPQELKAGIPSSTVGGFFVGAIIIILLLVLIILIIGIVLWKVNKGHSPSRYETQVNKHNYFMFKCQFVIMSDTPIFNFLFELNFTLKLHP